MAVVVTWCFFLYRRASKELPPSSGFVVEPMLQSGVLVQMTVVEVGVRETVCCCVFCAI